MIVESPSLTQEVRLLVADDSAVVREHLTELLNAVEGVSVVGVCDSVASTLAAIQEHRPDVVILDFQLPDGNATDVLTRLPARAGRRPEVLVLTNFADSVTRSEVLKAGATGFFDKSKQFMDMVRRVSDFASQRVTNRTVD